MPTTNSELRSFLTNEDLRRLVDAAEKFVIAADKAVELMGAAVSQLDELRAEVSKLHGVPKAPWIEPEGRA